MADKKLNELTNLNSVTDDTLLYAVQNNTDFKTTPRFIGANLPDVATKGFFELSFTLPLIESGTIPIDKVTTELIAPGAAFTLSVAPKGRLKIILNKSGGTSTINTIGLGFTSISVAGLGSVILLSDGTQWIVISQVNSTLS